MNPPNLTAAAVEYRDERARGESHAVPRRYDAPRPLRAVPKFVLEPFESIKFEVKEEWLVKRILPRQGFVSLYGASQSFKSFLASHLAMYVALGWEWAGRRVEQSAAVYIAAEGAAGLRKRKVGFELTYAERLPEMVPFFLISASPNLGTEQGDLADLISAVESRRGRAGLDHYRHARAIDRRRRRKRRRNDPVHRQCHGASKSLQGLRHRDPPCRPVRRQKNARTFQPFGRRRRSNPRRA